MTDNKQRELKRHQKYRRRKLFLRFVYGFLFLFLAIFSTKYFLAPQKINITKQTDTSVVGDASMYRVSSKYNPRTKLLVSEFYVGNKSDVNDVSADKDLSNIKYEMREAVQTGTNAGKSKLVKVNDHFFVIETTNLPKGYAMFKYMIHPVLIDKNVETEGYDDQTLIQYYVRESKVKNDLSLRPKDKFEYTKNYTDILVKAYNKKIKRAQKQIAKSEASIKSDRQQIAKMRAKKEIASNSQKEDLDSQISDLKQDIEQEEQTLKQERHAIKANLANIRAARRGSLDF